MLLQVEKLCADINTVVPGRRLDDDGAVLLRLSNGASGVLVATQVAAGEENNVRVRAYGDKGGLEWQQVDANTPSALPPMTSAMPRNRLGLAQWLFTDDNPLTARVAVNRMWQEIFGTAIVKTAEDFGSQSEPPSHQELLDWLAVDFRQHGWDVKRFYRQILLSATYRQAAIATP